MEDRNKTEVQIEIDQTDKQIQNSNEKNKDRKKGKKTETGSVNSENGTPDPKKKRKKKKRKNKDKEENSTLETLEKDLNLSLDVVPEEIKEDGLQENRNTENCNSFNDEVNECIKKNNLPLKIVLQKDYFEVDGEDIVGGRYTRVVIIGDSFLLDYSKLWPCEKSFKPYFLYKNKLSVEELYAKFHDHPFMTNSEKILVLFMLGLHDFAEYATFLKASCTGNHLFTEYLHDGKKYNANQCRRYIQNLCDTKENFELDRNLSVAFCYFPELKNVRSLRTIFNAFPEDMPNCTCLCRSLGELPGKNTATHFGTTLFNINHKLAVKQLNSPRGKTVFEYMPPTVSFVNGNWRLTRPRECSQDDVLVLRFLLMEHIYGDEIIGVTNESDEVKKLLAAMRSRIRKCKFRFVLIGDPWIELISRQWPLLSKIVPYFYFAENLTFGDICKVILSLIRKEEIGLVITAVPMGELFAMKVSSKCEGHNPLGYPVPHEDILKDPVGYAQQLITKMNKFLEETKQLRQYCGVVFTTCYPIEFASYYKYLSNEHYKYLSNEHSVAVGDVSHPDSDPVINETFCDFEKKVSQCLEVINQYIISSHQRHELPLCNIYNVINSSSEDFTFPTFIEGKCPPKFAQKNLFSCVKNYVVQFYDLCNARKLTFTHTEEYKKKEESRRRRALKKQKYKIAQETSSRISNFSAAFNAEMCAYMNRLNISENSKFPANLSQRHVYGGRQSNLRPNPRPALIPTPRSSTFPFNQPVTVLSNPLNASKSGRRVKVLSPGSSATNDFSPVSYDAQCVTNGSQYRISSYQN